MNACNQRAIELDARQRQFLERCQGGISDTKIIERDSYPLVSKLTQYIDGSRAGLQHIFRELNLDTTRRQSMLAQQAHDVINETSVKQLAGGEIDGDAGL